MGRYCPPPPSAPALIDTLTKLYNWLEIEKRTMRYGRARYAEIAGYQDALLAVLAAVRGTMTDDNGRTEEVAKVIPIPLRL